MTDEPKALREIHEIREQLYKEMKSMTPEEYMAHVNREAEELAKKYNLKITSQLVHA